MPQTIIISPNVMSSNCKKQPIYVATITGSNGQVIAKFRLKKLGVTVKNEVVCISPRSTRNLTKIVVMLPATLWDEESYFLVDCNGKAITGAYLKNDIYRRLPIETDSSGNILNGKGIGVYSGIWWRFFEDKNTVILKWYNKIIK